MFFICRHCCRRSGEFQVLAKAIHLSWCCQPKSFLQLSKSSPIIFGFALCPCIIKSKQTERNHPAHALPLGLSNWYVGMERNLKCTHWQGLLSTLLQIQSQNWCRKWRNIWPIQSLCLDWNVDIKVDLELFGGGRGFLEFWMHLFFSLIMIRSIILSIVSLLARFCSKSLNYYLGNKIFIFGRVYFGIVLFHFLCFFPALLTIKVIT